MKMFVLTGPAAWLMIIVAACSFGTSPPVTLPALAGTPWMLVAHQAAAAAADEAVAAVPPNTFALSFARADRLRGTSACHTVSGRYEAGAGGQFAVRTLTGSTALCTAREAVFRQALATAYHYEHQGTVLRLFHRGQPGADGRPYLIFRQYPATS